MQNHRLWLSERPVQAGSSAGDQHLHLFRGNHQGCPHTICLSCPGPWEFSGLEAARDPGAGAAMRGPLGLQGGRHTVRSTVPSPAPCPAPQPLSPPCWCLSHVIMCVCLCMAPWAGTKGRCHGPRAGVQLFGPLLLPLTS